jgi:protein associated with RNAse G/E
MRIWRGQRAGAEKDIPMQESDPITIRKFDHDGRETWRYTGRLVARGANWMQIEAHFDRPDMDDGYVVFRQGDRFVEWYYADRWYNIFEIHDVDDDRIKGWYCNITRPALLSEDTVIWPDLALDVWISPNGEVLVLDEAEFAALPLDAATRTAALHALDEVRGLVARRAAPFSAIRG